MSRFLGAGSWPRRNNTLEISQSVGSTQSLFIESLGLSLLQERRAQLAMKRIIDVLAASTFLVVLLPLFLLIGLLIKLTSRGPIFFCQQRIGQHWKPFTMYKFRTMEFLAEKQEQAFQKETCGMFFKVKNDPRVTRLGRFLRKYSMDELPQLVNVLIGNMSLIGPRPLLMIEFPNFTRERHAARFLMKPGLTGLWQVSGRNNTTDEERLRYDLEYTENWSLMLDVAILAKTLPVVLTGDGAY